MKGIITGGSSRMAGETGVDREGPSLRAPVIPSPGWDRGTQYITKMGPFYFSLTVFVATAIVV